MIVTSPKRTKGNNKVTQYTAKPNLNRCPTHPGAVLREDMLPASGKKKVEIAQLLGISRQHLHDIMAEKKPISPEVAVRIGKLFGGGPGIWVRMQAAHDTWHAERNVDVSGIPTLKVA
jgi:antitoxin HigA-1